VQLSFNVSRFHVFYWMSYAKQSGAEMEGDSFKLTVGLQLHKQALPDDLRRRPQACWTVSQLDCDLDGATVWLCSVDMAAAAVITVEGFTLFCLHSSHLFVTPLPVTQISL